ncbi:hypothetical protein [Clostridium drakei]|uniref:Uncharacterized protein n=1 Tax=Clostridium drakei TaxID=332101 RepID=A0A2U8DVL2_9CLOT|nr:hypothetical protein [Clostridium drakei]AWI06294.1 hypothetical protein B9W14_17880 [Clostridium drakei]
MSLLAETLVEEWFNRRGYFTIRGIKETVDEIDIFAIKNVRHNCWNCVHCEVQVGIRPVTYISRLTKQLMIELNVKNSNSAKQRTLDQLNKCVDAWVEMKFTNTKKESVCSQLFGETNWNYMFVYG